jgi:hypothetical protein
MLTQQHMYFLLNRLAIVKCHLVRQQKKTLLFDLVLLTIQQQKKILLNELVIVKSRLVKQQK